MKPIFILFLSIFFISALSCSNKAAVKGEGGDETNRLYMETESALKRGPERHKVLILPFECKTGPGEYANPAIYKTVVFSSFYSFFFIMPGIDLPDRSVLTNIILSDESIPETARRYNSDFIIFGSYELKGKKSNPTALISMKIWSGISGSIVSNSFSTPTDMDLFDTVDAMSGLIIKSVLNEEMKLARLNLGSFKTEKESMEVYINDKLASGLSNDAFSLSLKILSGSDYKVNIVRPQDKTVLLSRTIRLAPGESLTLGATNDRMTIIINSNSYLIYESPAAQWAVNGHYYQAVYVSSVISWTDARLAAEKKGGHLAAIGDKAENEFVFSLISDKKFWFIDGKDSNGPWLGGYLDKDRKWSWVDGSPWTYENWYPGQPDNWRDLGEDTIQYYSAGRFSKDNKGWNDARHDTRDPNDGGKGYIIEWDDKPPAN